MKAAAAFGMAPSETKPRVGSRRTAGLLAACCVVISILSASPTQTWAQSESDILPVCQRTPEIRNAIVSAISGVSRCQDVTAEHLGTITSIAENYTGSNITSLKSGDFSGITALQTLDFSYKNLLTSLPSDVFDGLTSLHTLRLENNSLSSLPEDVFDDLSSLHTLRLENNSLSSLPEDVFDGLTSLQTITLRENSLTSLPSDVFDGLTSLRTLDLHDNSLRTLPSDVFDGLTSLRNLYLGRNSLNTLPSGVFDGLSNLQELDLITNGLTSLSANVFSDLSSLTDLALSFNVLSSLSKDHFNGLSSLSKLHLAYNRLSSLPEDVFDHVLPTLTLLFLDNNSLTCLPAAVKARSNALRLGDSASLPLCPAVILSATNVSVNEGGANTYTVKLRALPTGNVTVTPSSNSGEVTVAPSSLTFTTGNWETPQTVTVTAGQDTDTVDDSAIISHAVSGADYGSVTVEELIVAVTDDDRTDVVFSATEQTIVEGGTGVYTVTLNTAPTSSATITPISNNRDVTVDPSPLTFTTANWQTPRTVTVHVNHDADFANESAAIDHAVSGGGYSFTTAGVVSVTVTDDDSVCLRTTQVRSAIVAAVAAVSGVSDCANVTSGHAARITVGLDLRNKDIASLQSGDFFGLSSIQHLRLNNNRLTSLPTGVFDGLRSLDWLYLENNQLTSLPAGVFDGLRSVVRIHLHRNQLSSLREDVFEGRTLLSEIFLHTNQLSSLPEDLFDGLSRLRDLELQSNQLSSLPEDLFDGLGNLQYLQLQSNQLSSLPEDVFAGLGRLKRLYLSENQLSSLPSDVFDGLRSVSRLRLDRNQLSSLPANVFDGLSKLQDLDLVQNSLTCLPAALLARTSVTLDVTLPACRAVTISLTELEVQEGATGTYTVVLDTQPTGSVTVTPSSDNTDVTFVPATLTFTATDWETSQTVTVTAANDSDSQDDTATISHAVTGGGYGSVTVADVAVTVTDNDEVSTTPDDTAPRVTSITRQTPASSPTNADSLTWHVTFSEDVANVDAADFEVSGTTAALTYSTVTASTVHSVTASGGNLASLDGTVTLAFASDQNIADTAGNPNPLTNTTPTGTNDNSYVVDNTAPTVTITDVPAISAAAFTAEFTFSESVTGFAQADIALGNGTASSFTDSTGDTQYTAVITPTATGTVTVDVAANAAMDLAGNNNTAAAQAMSDYDPNHGICGRTEQVRTAILARISGVTDCVDVTDAHLGNISGTLKLNRVNITALAAGDFAGLIALTTLNLSGNSLTALPDSVFDELAALTTLNLSFNSLTTLPDTVFDELTALTTLNLADNSLTALPNGVFDELTALTTLNLSFNSLTTLPDTVYDQLIALATLLLNSNSLTTLRDGVFDGLTALTTLNLNENSLTTLPDGVFEGLTALTLLALTSNDLAELPDDVFEPLTSLNILGLSGNPGVPFSPTAVALPDDGTVPPAGGTVMLDGSGSGGAWGTNVTYAWALTTPATGVTVTFDDHETTQPTVTIPPVTAGTDLVFTLTVTGRGRIGAMSGTSTATDTATVRVRDNIAPTVTSIERQSPTASPTNADSLTWHVTFSKDVTNVDAADFKVTGTTAALAVATVTASTVHSVTASGGNLASLDGTVTLAFAADQDIAVTGGSALTNTTPTGTNDNSYVVDNTAPTAPTYTAPSSLQVGEAITVMSPSGGSGIDEYAATGLPSGLSIDSASGAINGTPDTASAGTASATVTASDSAGNSVTVSIAFPAVAKGAQTLSGFAYSASSVVFGSTAPTVTAPSGAQGALSYAASPSAVCTVDDASGALTIVGVGSCEVTVTAAATANYDEASVSYTIVVQAAGTLVLSVDAITGDDVVNIAEKAAGFAITGGTGSEGGVSVTVTIGSTTLTATSSATSGTATWSVSVPLGASYIAGQSVTVSVSASKTGFTSPDAVARTLTVDLVAPTAPTYTAPSSLQVGEAITVMSPSGGSGIDEYAATGLPSGLSIDSASGAINGTPDTASAGTASATVTASDSAGNSVTVSTAFPAVAKGAQTLSGFAYSASSVVFGSTAPTVTAPSGAQGALSYAASPSAVCTVDDASGALTIVGVGSCEVTVTAAATANYDEASVSYTIVVQAAGTLVLSVDAITGDDVVNIAEKAAGFAITGGTGSEGGVSVTVTIGSTTLTATSSATSGTATWSVSVPLGASYIAGQSVTVSVSASKTGFTSPDAVARTLTVDLVAPTAPTYTAPSSLQVGEAITVMSPSGGSGIDEYAATGLPSGLSIDSASGAINGTPDTASAGTASATVTASDSAGNSVTVSIAFPAVAKGAQTLSGFAYSASSVVFGSTAPTVTAPSGAQGALSYAASPSAVCTVDDASGALTIVGVGSCEVTVTAAATANYDEASVSYTIVVQAAGTLVLSVDAITGDDVVNIAEKAAGFAITGGTGSEGGVSVTVTIGSTTLTATSSATSGTATWSVSVPLGASYIAGQSVTVSVSASKTGFTSPDAVARTLTVDLVAPTAPTYTAPSSLQVGEAITVMSPSGGSGIDEYAATGLPSGLSIDSASGAINGTPDTASAGTASATVTASDSAGNSVTVSTAFPAVAKGAQTLSGFAYSASSVVFGSTAPTVTAPSGAQGALSYAASPSAVCTVDDASGALTIVGVGSCEVTVTAAATANYDEASVSYTIVVQAAGTLVLSVDAITGDDVVNIAEKAAGFAITGGTGSEGGVSVTVTIGSTTLTATSSATSGTATWSVSVPLGASYIAGQSVTVSVSASKTGFTSPDAVARTLTVDLVAPTAPTYTAPSSLQVGEAITVMSPSGGSGIDEYAATGLPSGLSIDSASGAINGTPDTASAGTASATVTASDSAGNSVTVSIAFPAVAKGAQTLSGFAYSASSVVFGSTAPTVTAPSGAQGALSYAASPSAVCTVDDASGALTIVGVGSCEVTVTAAATANYDEASVSYTIVVQAAGTLVLSVDAITGDDVVNIAEKAAGFAITGGTGSEGGVSVTVTIGSTTLTATSSATSGTATWSVSVPLGASYIAGQSVTVSVSASKTGFTSPDAVARTLTVDLVAPTAPTYTAPSSLQVGEAITVMSPSGGSGIDEYAATGLPSGLSIDSASGAINGTPDTASAGTASATVTASDSAGNSVTVSIAFPAVAKGAQTLSGFAYSASSVVFGSTAPTVTAPSGAQGALSYAASPSAVCTVDDASGALTIVGVGSCEVTVTAAATANYDEASVSYTIVVQAAGTLVLSVDAITGDDVVNIAEKAAGFAITGGTGSEGGVSVTVTIGSTTLTATSSATSGTATWSVSVPLGASYIAGQSVTVSVSASKTGFTSPDAVARTLTVDLVAPTVTVAMAEGRTVEVTWSEALDGTSAPTSAGGFRVKIGTGNGPSVTAVAVSGTTTNLSLASPIPDGTQDAALEYNGRGNIRDVAGNDAEGFTGSDALDVMVTPDTTAPTVTTVVIDGATLTVTFDEPLDAASFPAVPGGFIVTVTRSGNTVSGHTVSEVAVTGPAVTLTLAKGVLAGDAVTLQYTAPSGTKLQDRAVTPNGVANFTTGTSSVPRVTNETGVLEVTLSKATTVEGDDATITLTVAVAGNGTSGAARVIAVAASGTPTATESEDWTLQSGTGTLETGAKSVAIPITIIDDARLEAEETVTFAVTADGAAIGTVELTIDDDDRAVLAVVGPGSHVTEGGEAFTIKLRLEPHPDNGPPVADDACFLDFPVTAILSVAGGASELTGTPTLPGEYTFAATAFDDCTREVTVDLETRASDGNWTDDRTVSFALARKSDQDARIDPGEAQVTVRDNTAPPGPLVVSVDMPAAPSGAVELAGPFRTRKAFYDRDEVPDDAVHGAGGRLTFTLTFEEPVTVEDGSPELVLDVWKRARRAQLITPTEQLSDTNTLTFAWTVAKGDNDPDGIRIAGLDLNGARIRFAAGCEKDSQGNDLPCDIDLPTFAARYGKTYSEHRVRGGLHSIALSVSGGAREGQPFAFAATRDGGFGEEMYAIVQIEDSAFPDQVVHRKVEFAAGRASDDGVARTTATFTPQGDGAADPDGERRLTLFVGTTEVGSFAPACVFAGASETCTQWYDTPEGEDGAPVTFAVAVADTGLAEGTPSLAVRDAYGGGVQEPSQEQVDSGTDAPLSFHVMLSKTSNSAVTVDYTTHDGTATAGADYVAASGTLTFEPGETVKTVEVRVLPDSHDEGSETLSLVLSNAGGAAIGDAEGIGTIFNTGPIPRAWIARFGRTVAEQMLEAVEGRMRAAPAPGVEVSLAGQQIGVGSGPAGEQAASGEDAVARQEEEARRDAQRLTDWLNSETDDEVQYQSRAVTSRDLLTGSSFTLTEETPGKDMVSFWGRGVVTSFEGREGGLTLDGEVATGMFGADWTRGRWTTGLILSHSSGEGSYSDGSGSGTDTDAGSGGSVEATLTGLFPWTRHALSDRLEAWGVAGYGAGDLTVTPKKPGTDEDGAVIRADLADGGDGFARHAAGWRRRWLDADGQNRRDGSADGLGTGAGRRRRQSRTGAGDGDPAAPRRGGEPAGRVRWRGHADAEPGGRGAP